MHDVIVVLLWYGWVAKERERERGRQIEKEREREREYSKYGNSPRRMDMACSIINVKGKHINAQNTQEVHHLGSSQTLQKSLEPEAKMNGFNKRFNLRPWVSGFSRPAAQRPTWRAPGEPKIDYSFTVWRHWPVLAHESSALDTHRPQKLPLDLTVDPHEVR